MLLEEVRNADPDTLRAFGLLGENPHAVRGVEPVFRHAECKLIYDYLKILWHPASLSRMHFIAHTRFLCASCYCSTATEDSNIRDFTRS